MLFFLFKANRNPKSAETEPLGLMARPDTSAAAWEKVTVS
jgi:hypothetical protein